MGLFRRLCWIVELEAFHDSPDHSQILCSQKRVSGLGTSGPVWSSVRKHRGKRKRERKKKPNVCDRVQAKALVVEEKWSSILSVIVCSVISLQNMATKSQILTGLTVASMPASSFQVVSSSSNTLSMVKMPLTTSFIGGRGMWFFSSLTTWTGGYWFNFYLGLPVSSWVEVLVSYCLLFLPFREFYGFE